jgi:UDP-N-acetylglucosamine--N-acetylmuramyl-(pentapeptide) pyrophosphoryl-undecaprenol N-acetylglucosamine transferase
LGKKATRIFVASDGMEKFFPAGRISVVGNPVRSVIVQSRLTREEGIRFFGLDPALPTVLSTGGSLGAKGINEAIASRLDDFGKNDLQLIWQTGKPFAEQAAVLGAGRNKVWTRDFIPQMEYAFAAADIVVSRSGAMSIAELCVARKPVVFVPFPFAAEDHQTVNAQHLVDKHAGLMVKDSEAKEKLVDTVLALAKDKARQSELSSNIGRLAITDAGDRIAAEILKAVKA